MLRGHRDEADGQHAQQRGYRERGSSCSHTLIIATWRDDERDKSVKDRDTGQRSEVRGQRQRTRDKEKAKTKTGTDTATGTGTRGRVAGSKTRTRDRDKRQWKRKQKAEGDSVAGTEDPGLRTDD